MTDSLLPISYGHLSASCHDKAAYRYSDHSEHGSESNAESYGIQPYQEARLDVEEHSKVACHLFISPGSSIAVSLIASQ